MLNFLLGFWQFGLVWAVGMVLERRCRFNLPYGYRMAIAFGLGEVLISYLLFALGLFGGLRFWVLVPSAVIASILFYPQFIREVAAIARHACPWLRLSPLASIIIVCIWVIYLLAATVPDREVDSLWYHLAVPLYYITHGGFIQLVPFNMPSHYPMNLHLHYVLSLLVGNDTTTKVFILLHWLPMMVLLWAVVKHYGEAGWGLFAVAVYLCGLQFRLPVMTNNERAIYFYVFLSTALLWWALEKRSWKELLFASLFCGMAMGTKFNGLLFGYIGQWLLMLVWFFVLRKESFLDGMKKWIAHSLIAWAIMSPWLIKSYIYTNNPFYPMLGSVFATDEHFVGAMLSNDRNHGLNLMKSENVSQFIDQVLKNMGWLLFNADLIFFLGLLALFVLAFLRRKDWLLPTLSLSIAYVLFTLLWGSDIARLFAANYGVIVAATALAIMRVSQHIAYGKLLASLILLSLFITFLQQKYLFLMSPNIRWYGQVALSENARREWLTERNLFNAELFRMKDWMDENLPPEDELYGYRTGYLFYLDRKYIVSGAHFGEQMQFWLPQGPEYTVKQLLNLDVKWLLANDETHIFAAQEEQAAWKAFRDTYLDEVHREGSVVLYHLSPNAPI